MEKQDKELTSSFGNYIKCIRESKGLRLKDLSRRSKISIPYLNRLEHNKRKSPSIAILKQLANALEVSVIDVLEAYLEISKQEDRNLREVLLERKYSINGKVVTEEISIILSEIIECIINNNWKYAGKSSICIEELQGKIIYLNKLL